MDHAVVVGAGIGGLTASLVLSRVAARVTLVERAERPSESARPWLCSRTAWRFWAASDCYRPLRLSARIDGLDIRGATGRELLSVRMPDLGAGLDHAIAIRRTDLHRLLLDAVAGVASV